LASEALDKDSSSAIGDANISWWPEGEQRLRNVILIENREPGARVAAVGVVVEEVAVEPERQDRKSAKAPVSSERAKTGVSQDRGPELRGIYYQPPEQS
jgi:hypothetical protein